MIWLSKMPVGKEAMLTHEEPACLTGTRHWWIGAACAGGDARPRQSPPPI